MKFTPILAGAVTILTTTMGLAGPPTTPLGSNPILGGGGFSIGGGITVAIEPRRAHNGQLALCGVWAVSDRLSAYVRPHVRDVLALGSLAVNGRVTHHDLRVFPQVAPAENYAGAEATCIATHLDFGPNTQIDIRIPRQTVVRERNSGNASLEIRFVGRDNTNPALGSGSLLPTKWTRFLSGGNTFGSDRPTQ